MLVFLVVVDGKDKWPLRVDDKVRRRPEAAASFVRGPVPG